MKEGDERQNHIMYASKSLINDYFVNNISEVEKKVLSKKESTKGKGKAGINAILDLGGDISKGASSETIHEINFDDDRVRVKKVINQLSSSNDIYPLPLLRKGDSSPSGLYHFDCLLQLIRVDDGLTDSKSVQVIGLQDDVKFKGHTSIENWASRSHLITAIKTKDPYPFKGVLRPMNIPDTEVERLETSVQFMYILAPDLKENKEWREHQELLDEHPGFDQE